MRFEDLPDDIHYEVFRRLSKADTLCLGAASKQLNQMAKVVIEKKMCRSPIGDRLTYDMWKFLRNLKKLGMETSHGGQGWMVCSVAGLHMSDSSYRDPSAWSCMVRNPIFDEEGPDDNLPPEEDDLFISGCLRVETRPWSFHFHLREDSEAPTLSPEVLFEKTTYHKRFRAVVILLTCWYMYAARTLDGRRLRSAPKRTWLPEKLPTLREYVRLCIRPAAEFIRGRPLGTPLRAPEAPQAPEAPA